MFPGSIEMAWVCQIYQCCNIVKSDAHIIFPEFISNDQDIVLPQDPGHIAPV